MAKTMKNRRNWLRRMRTKYKLVLMHDKTFEVRVSLRLSPWNVIVLSSTLFVVTAVIVCLVIAFTPLRNLIVGYSDVETARNIMKTSYETDSVIHSLQAYDLYFANLRHRLNGDVDTLGRRDTSGRKDYSDLQVQGPSEMDKILRGEVEEEDLFNLNSGKQLKTGNLNLSALYFFPPLKGTVTSGFDPLNGHFGIDVVAQENTPVKACLDGVVIDAYWSVETGNVIVIQHDHGLISFYRHNSRLLKQRGNYVHAGDVIAIIGNTGEMSTGPHLHFELWHEKTPLDPQEFINFN